MPTKQIKFPTSLDTHIEKGETSNIMEKQYKKTTCKETGRQILIEDGEIDITEYINKHKDKTDIKNYIATNDNGEVVAVHEVNKAKAHYGDFTEVPETRIEMLDTINNAKKLGKYLEEETKKQMAIEEERTANKQTEEEDKKEEGEK